MLNPGDPARPFIEPPRRSRWHGTLAVLGAVVLAVVAYVGMASVAEIASHGTVQGLAFPDPAALSTAAPSAEASSPSSAKVSPPTNKPTVAPPPRPTGPQPVYATTTNPLMADVGMPDGTCNLPPWSRYEQGVRAFFDAALDCMNQRWQPVMVKLNLPWQAPTIAVTLESKTSECGDPDDPYNSYYCSASKLITIVPKSYLTSSEGPQHSAAIALATLAHEYGHHLQWLSGIDPAYAEARADAGKHTPPGLQLSRRLELQAQCLAGVAVGATFDAPTTQSAIRDAHNRGDYPGREPDHGLPENSGAWFAQGATKNKLAECNTFAADGDDVS